MRRHICNLRTWLCLAVALAAVTLHDQAAAGSPEQGKALAQLLCARCHSVEKLGRSAHPKAPPFREIARRYPPEHLAEALAEGIVVGHSDMPVLRLSPEEIERFLDYLEEMGRD